MLYNIKHMTARPFSFAATFLALFALTFTFMYVTDSLPETQSAQRSSEHAPALSAQNQTSVEEPARVVAKDVGLDAEVVNPTTTNVEILDRALEDGAVRYPTSALLNEEGTMLLFGHSSYLPIVYHDYYKTFNGIQNLKAGQIVSVYSGAAEYRYEVTGVRLANAEEDVVELPQSGKHLILVTCDSFASKSSRYVVTADFVGAYQALAE